jgi:HlyD family secretion protein
MAEAQASARRSSLDLDECALKAPRAAVVLSRNFEPGELVTPGAAVLNLVDVSDLRMTFFLANADLADAAPGREVEIEADAYPGEKFAGRILSVAPKAEFTPRNIQTREDRDRLVYAVRVKVTNRDHRLRPGMPVEARILGTVRRPSHARGG